jgi:hypothetical protein
MRPTAYLVLSVALVACGPSGRGDDIGGDDTGGGDGGGSGSNQDNCSEASKLVYVVDNNNQMSQFDPSTKTFKDLGALNCPAGAGFAPFSMGVDRNATAYVLYVNADPLTGDPLGSKIFKVDTTVTGLPCTATSFTPDPSMKEFGMGFSTDTAGGSTDKLYIAGSNDASTTSNAKLATLDVSTMAVTMVPGGTIQGSPELTGNANAELWAFFPDATNPKIQGINKASGAAITPAPLPAGLKGEPAAWAFAFYGGDYWIFLAKQDGLGGALPTTVYQVSPTGALKGMTPTTNRRIVGAGVSTCAPVVIL